MTAIIHQGNVFDVLPALAKGSVDCAVTSPPYWMLRSYLHKDHPLKPLELGSEKTPAEYVASMVRVFRLVREAMAEHGTVWLNIGDSYNGYYAGQYATSLSAKNQHARHVPEDGYGARAKGLECGNLCLIPWRLAIALQDDGWVIRSIVVWHKPAPMPSSVKGWMWCRCRVKTKAGQSPARNGKPELRQTGNGVDLPKVASAFPDAAQWSDCPGCKKCTPHGGYVLRKGSWRPTSSWEPVMLLAKSERYFCDGEPVKTEPAAATVSRDNYTRVLDDPDEQFAVRHDHETLCDNGANLRDVWTIAAEPLKEKHYAAFPTRLVELCLRAGTSAKGYCPTCGKPWCRVVESKPMQVRPGPGRNGLQEASNGGGTSRTAITGTMEEPAETKTIGWRPSCSCPEAEPRPGLVLDPFCGSGRTAITAGRLGLDFVGVDLNPTYVDMARKLVKQDAPLFS